MSESYLAFELGIWASVWKFETSGLPRGDQKKNRIQSTTEPARRADPPIKAQINCRFAVDALKQFL